MTITTERCNEIYENPEQCSYSEIQEIAAMLGERLAAREAVPLGYIDPASIKEYRGQRAGGTWSPAQRTTSGLNMTMPIYLDPPAPAYPENLPCPVRLMPGLLFGKGVPTERMLDALKMRAEYGSELEAVGGWLKSMLTTPAPAVPREIPLTSPVAAEYAAGWNACRAAMLGNSNYPEIPEGWVSCEERMPEEGDVVLVCQEGGIIYCAEMQDGELYPDEFPRVPSEGREITHWMPLPAAPEVGQ